MENKRRKCYPLLVPLMTCLVRYQADDFSRSVEVTAEALYEAVALGIAAMKVPREEVHRLRFDVKVQVPEVWHSVTGAALSLWLARNGRSPKEQALKQRVGEIMRA